MLVFGSFFAPFLTSKSNIPKNWSKLFWGCYKISLRSILFYSWYCLETNSHFPPFFSPYLISHNPLNQSQTNFCGIEFFITLSLRSLCLYFTYKIPKWFGLFNTNLPFRVLNNSLQTTFDISSPLLKNFIPLFALPQTLQMQ